MKKHPNNKQLNTKSRKKNKYKNGKAKVCPNLHSYTEELPHKSFKSSNDNFTYRSSILNKFPHIKPN